MKPPTPRPHDSREWRRVQALVLKQNGRTQREIAVTLGVTEAAVSKWMAAARRGGLEALRSHPGPGSIPKLADEQLHRLPDFLWHGPEAYGFRGNVWTCARIAGVIAQEFGVRYSKSQVSRLLKRLGWTPQVPLVRAIQRNDEAIEHWRAAVWPELLQRAHREHRVPVLMDESGFYLLPGVVKTYSPAGETPVVQEWQTRDHLSVVGAVTPQGKIATMVRQEAINGLHIIEFVLHLGHVIGDRLLLIWDNSPIHRRVEVMEFLAEVGPAIHLEPLPPYAPDLNPVEWLWKHLKQVELRNLACLDLEELHMELHLALGRVRKRLALVRSFFEGAGLTLET
jgi:transposase